MFIRKNILFFLLLLLAFVKLKLYFQHTDNDGLYFMLMPTNALVSLITGSHAIYSNEAGFQHEQLAIVIEKSCAGFNLFLIFLMVLSYLAIKYFQTAGDKIKHILLATLTAWIITILVNASRIWTSIIVQSVTKKNWPQSQQLIHECIGIFINLSALLMVYFFLDRYLSGKMAEGAKQSDLK